MAATFTYFQDRDPFDWESAFFHWIENGSVAFEEGSDPQLDPIHLNGTNAEGAFFEVLFYGVGLTVTNGALDPGTVTMIVVSDANGTIWSLEGTAIDSADLNALFLNGGALNSDSQEFRNVFQVTQTDFIGSGQNGDSMFGSSGADSFDVSASTGGFNYIRLGGSTAGTPDSVLGSANAFDFVDTIWFAYPTGIAFDTVNGEMRVVTSAVGNDVYATVSDADGFRGTEFDDIFIGTTGRGFFFITGRGDGGSDTLNSNGADWFNVSFQDLNGGNGLTVTQNGQDGSVVVGLETSTFTGVTQLGGSQYDDTFNGSDDGDETWQGFNGADTFNGGNGDGWDEVTYENEHEINSATYYTTGLSTYGVFINQSGNGVGVASLGLDPVALTAFLGGREVSPGVPGLEAGPNEAIDTFDKTDTLNGIEGVIGSVRADVMVGGDDDNVYRGAGGDDWLFGNDGDDDLRGDDGNGEDGADHLYGGDGEDSLEGGGGGDVIDGGNDNDDVRGDAGNDWLTGGGGNDILKGGRGSDFMDGGNDRDRINYNLETTWTDGSATHGVIVNLSFDTISVLESFLYGSGQDLITVASNTAIDAYAVEDNEALSTDTINSVEQIDGTGYADYLVGSDLANEFNGDGGSDFLDGGDGNDTLTGGNGDDILTGGRSADTIDGGSGRDRLNYNLETTWTGDIATHGVIVNLSDGSIAVAESIFYGAGHDDDITVAGGRAVDAFASEGDEALSTDTIINVEQIDGTGYADYIVGSTGSDSLNANGGTDFLDGGGEDDSLRGGSGDDVVLGGTGDDYLVGGSGSDTYDGGSDYDILNFSNNRGSSGGLVITFTAALVGGGTITGSIEDDEDGNGGLGQQQVDSTFRGFERVVGSDNDDDFVASSNSTNTNEADRGPDNASYIVVTGGDGLDAFIDNTTPVASTATSMGAFRVNYDQEKWTHEGFGDNGDDWGDNGESGVLVNLVKGSLGANFMGTGVTVAGGTARDTYGKFDTFSDNGSDVEVRSFQLTNAQDFLTGGSLSIDIQAGGGNDFITGGTGNDNLSGDDGNDTVDGGAGVDFVMGGRGNDDLRGGTSPVGTLDVLSYEWEAGPSGVDVIWDAGTGASGEARDTFGNTDQFDEFEIVRGTDQRDLFVGNDGNNQVEGNRGIDLFEGGAGSDTFRYNNEKLRPNPTGNGIVANLELVVDGDGTIIGRGRDTFGFTDYYENVENIVGTDFADNIRGSSVTNTLAGRSGADSLFGMGGADTLLGEDGDDVLDGGAGVDSLFGGDGVDLLDGGAGGDSLDGGTGIDTVTYQSASAGVVALFQNFAGAPLKAGDALGDSYDHMENLRGSTFADYLGGHTGVNTVEGLIGDDTLNGGAGLDTLIGGLGNDTYVIDWTLELGVNDTITELAGEGTDTVQFTGTANGQSYTLTLTATSQLENLVLLGGFNTNGVGNALNNVFTGNSGINTFAGDNGNDTYNLQNTGDVANEISATGGTDFVNFTGTANAQTYVLQLNGFVENLTLLGNFAINGTGNIRNNVITGNALANTLSGGDGNDTLNGMAGLDNLVGGNGNDTYVINRLVDGATTDTVSESGAVASLADLVQFTANAANQLYTLVANVENLTLLGTLATNGTGNGLNNVIIGNGGANTLNGSTGNDTLTGGALNDIFVFNTAPNATTNRDRITDLNASGNDTVYLENTIFTGLGVANNRVLTAAEFNINNNNGLALDPTDRIIYDRDSGQLWYDSNGSVAGGVIVNFATVNANQVLAAADFFVI